MYNRGQRREDLEREYLENYHATDERVPRFRQLPGGRLVHVKDLHTAEELKASPTYNEALPLALRAVRPVGVRGRGCGGERGPVTDAERGAAESFRGVPVAIASRRCSGEEAESSWAAKTHSSAS